MTAFTLEKRNVIQRRAWNIIADAVRTRELVTPLYCERCGKQCRLDAHHEDYSKPLEVEWLCASCHSLRHAKLRDKAWKAIGGKYVRRAKT